MDDPAGEEYYGEMKAPADTTAAMKNILVASIALFAANVLFAQTNQLGNEQRTISGTNLWYMAQTRADRAEILGEWSVPIRFIRARLVVCETNNVAVAYLELQNADLSVNPHEIYYAPWGFSDAELRDPKGETIPKLPGLGDGPLPPGLWLTLPADSILRLRSNPICQEPGEPVPGEFLVSAGMDVWRIPPGITNDFFLSGNLSLNAPAGEPVPSVGSTNWGTPIVWRGVVALPAVRIPVRKL